MWNWDFSTRGGKSGHSRVVRRQTLLSSYLQAQLLRSLLTAKNSRLKTKNSKTDNYDLLLPLQRPLHDVPNSILRRLARVQDSVNLFRDRHFDPMFAGQRQQRRGGIHALGNHAHIREDFAQSSPFAQLDSHKAIAAERACASENQTAHPPHA